MIQRQFDSLVFTRILSGRQTPRLAFSAATREDAEA